MTPGAPVVQAPAPRPLVTGDPHVRWHGDRVRLMDHRGPAWALPYEPWNPEDDDGT